MNDLNELLETADAMIWANRFVFAVNANSAIATDESTITGWFANAVANQSNSL
jgi:hypothetical protein